jgi:protein O-GlcNAc transferase
MGGHNLAVAFHHAGKLEEATHYYENAIKGNHPESYKIYYNLGCAFAALNRVDDAIVTYQSALSVLKGSYGTLYYRLAAILEERDPQGEAIANYEELIRRNPDFPEAHYRLGLLLRKRKDYSEASKEFAEAQKLDPRLRPRSLKRTERLEGPILLARVRACPIVYPRRAVPGRTHPSATPETNE